MSEFVKDQWVECVEPGDFGGVVLSAGFHRVKDAGDDSADICVEGIHLSLNKRRFRPVSWQVGRTYKTELKGVTICVDSVDCSMVRAKAPHWRHAMEAICGVNFHKTTGKLRGYEGRDDVPHLTPYLADEPSPAVETTEPSKSQQTSDDVHKFDTGAVRGTDANGTRFDLISPHVLQALAETYAEGAKKYGDDNWLRGIPSKDLMNHALRHINLWQLGDTTEDHLAHAMWNLGAIIHFQKTRPELIVRQYATAMEKEPGRE